MSRIVQNRTKLTRALAMAGALIMMMFLSTAAWSADPYTKPDATWISISGTVESVTADSFILDYGDGEIIVEMDDGDRDADAYKLLAGDKVTVNGMIDDDFFETTTIEASSVFVEKLGTFFYASAVDEEDRFITVTTPVVVAATTLQGIVTDVDPPEFTIDTGLRSINVDVQQMAYNPLDDVGYQKIEVGDLVRVTGSIRNQLFDSRELVAENIVTLVD